MMFFLKQKKGEWDSIWFSILVSFAPIKIKNQRGKYNFIFKIPFQGHIGLIGSRGAVGPQGPPVRQ